jgi:hypothetical protein
VLFGRATLLALCIESLCRFFPVRAIKVLQWKGSRASALTGWSAACIARRMPGEPRNNPGHVLLKAAGY